MADQLVGVGRVYVEIHIDGITDDDWAHLDSVVPVIQNPDGELIESAASVEIERDKRLVRFIHEFLVEGDYVIGVRCEFDDELWSTSYRNNVVHVTDAFSTTGAA